jgi:hypothetical protein
MTDSSTKHTKYSIHNSKISNLLEQAGMPVLLDASGRYQVGAGVEDVASYYLT